MNFMLSERGFVSRSSLTLWKPAATLISGLVAAKLLRVTDPHSATRAERP